MYGLWSHSAPILALLFHPYKTLEMLLYLFYASVFSSVKQTHLFITHIWSVMYHNLNCVC